MGKKEQGLLSLPRGVTIRKHKTASTLVITFTYKGGSLQGAPISA